MYQPEVVPVIVYIGRTTPLYVKLGFDVSADTLVSEIRAEADSESELIATWDIEFVTDGTDGDLLFTLDDSVTSLIDRTNCFMDIKRVTGGEPVSIFYEPVPVVCRKTVTQ